MFELKINYLSFFLQCILLILSFSGHRARLLDLKYHDFFRSDNRILLVDAGHFETEFFIKNKLQELLKEKIPNFAFIRSEINNNPVKYF